MSIVELGKILLEGVSNYISTMNSGSRDGLIANAAEKNKFVGVWFYYYRNRFSAFTYSSLDPSWITIFDNGEAYEDLPTGGFLHFDKDASKNDENQAKNWGTYIIKGNECIISRPGVINPTRLFFIKECEIELDSGVSALRVPNVDGFRLEGSWTTVRGDQNMDFINSYEDGERPLITFKKDGTFIDYGQFIDDIMWSSPRNAGQGTYEIKNYTLVLDYDNQPTAELSFSLHGTNKSDPLASDPTFIFLDRCTMNKV